MPQTSNVKCPICYTVEHIIPITDRAYAGIHRGMLRSFATWRKRARWIRCPLCHAKGHIPPELATAFHLIGTNKYELPRCFEIITLRRALAPRSRTFKTHRYPTYYEKHRTSPLPEDHQDQPATNK